MAQTIAECPTFNQASDVPAFLHDPHHDSKRPIFHAMAARGWASDPCGPVYYKGRYHMFYQHQRQSCQWFWGLCWDHVVSDDLVHWKNLPPAVVPTPGWYDADGCFSGTVELDPELGVPVIMYTGVYLKTNTESVAAHGVPLPQHDPGTRFVERQLAAMPADPDDPDLTIWTKLPTPVMEVAPAGLNISCWRDPYCIHRPASAGGSGDWWVVLLASGITGRGGAVLRFKSKHWTYGWEFDGILAAGDNNALGLHGQDWECPILAQLPDLPQHSPTATPAAAAVTETSPYVQALDSSSNTVGSNALVEQILAKVDSSSSSKPLQHQLSKPVGKKLGIYSNSNSSSTSSLLGVGYCPMIGCSTASASVTDIASISGSVISSAAAPAAGDTLSVCGASEMSIVSGVKAAAAGGSSSSTSLVSMVPPSPQGEKPDLAMLPASNTVPSAPLTEPVLAAAADAAHPAVNLFAWLEQTGPAATAATAAPQLAAAAAAAAMSGTVAASNSSSSDLESMATGLSYQKFLSGTLGSSSSLCDTAAAPAGEDLVMGTDVPGPANSSSSRKNWWFCMSPDACNNPIVWWLGDYDGRVFDLQRADGPHRLDLGTTLYAASLWQDPQGRQLLYGWIQEHRRVPTPPNNCSDFMYAGCISTPRVLHLHEGHLYQTPLPEIDALRTKVSWHKEDLLLEPTSPLMPLQVVSGTHLDINITFQPPAARFGQSNSGQTAVNSSLTKASWAAKKLQSQPLDSLNPDNPRSGLVFKSWRSDGQGAAALSFDWSNFELAVDFNEPFPDAYNPNPEDTPVRRRVGGKLINYKPGTPLTLRVLVDGSALEVFTSTGETLTTRIYRGHPPSCACTPCSSNGNLRKLSKDCNAAPEVQDETGIALFTANAAVTVANMDVWEMGSCWEGISPMLLDQLQQQQCAVQISAAALADAHNEEVLSMMTQRAASSALPSSNASIRSVGSSSDLIKSKVVDLAADLAAAVISDNPSDQVTHVPAGEEACVDEAFLNSLHINPMQA